MDTRRSKCGEDTDFKVEQVRDIYLKNYNNILTSGRCSTKDPKYAPIISILGVDQKLADDYKKLSEKDNTSNRDTTKGESDYIRDLPPWILEEPEYGVGNKTKDRKE